MSRELVEVAQRSGDGALVATAHGWRTVIALGSGEIERARQHAEALDVLAPQLGQPLYLWCGLYLRATLEILGGRLDSAEALAARAFELGRRASPQTATIVYFTQMVTIRREQGRIAEVIPLVEQNPNRMSADALVWNLPHFYLEADRIEDGRNAYEHACSLGFDAMPGENSRNRRLMTLGAMGLSCAALDDKRRAAALYGLVQPHAHRWAVVGWGAVSYGMLANAAGALASCLGNYDAAQQHFELAIEEYQRKNAMVALARAHHLYGSMILRRRARGDLSRARGQFERALRIADMHQLARVRALVERASGSPV